MSADCRAALLGVPALLLLLGGSAARANEADDSLHRLTAQAREQAKTGDSKGLAETLSAIVRAMPEATADGVSAVNELNVQLAGRAAAERNQGASDADPQSAAPQADPRPAEPEAAAPPASQTASPDRPTGPAASSSPTGAPVGASPEPLPPATPPAGDAAMARPAAPAALAERSPAPVAAAPAAPPEAPKAAAKSLTDLLRRQGDQFLAAGDVSGARRFYRRGADVGCGACAEAMAATYDAAQLQRLGAVGVKPDPAQADAWRARARQLGQAGTP